MNFNRFDELLHIDVQCDLALADPAALLIIGDRTADLTRDLQVAGKLALSESRIRVLFGLPILTAPFPLFVGGVMTERNTPLEQMSVFGWIEDHYIEQPRAEVFGLTPFAEQPVLFIRDFDLDRPVEAWFQSSQPARWVRVAGVAIATASASGDAQELKGDQAALAALACTLPADAQPFVDGLSLDVARGTPLRVALRQRRKTTDAVLMNVCDGWRVLAQAMPFVRFNPTAGHGGAVDGVLRLAPEKRW
jgi:hypothetical protein